MSSIDAQPTDAARPPLRWTAELLGAVNAAATTLAIAVAMGTLVFMPLGPRATALGVAAAILATVVGGTVASLASPTPLTISSPRAAASIVVAGFVAAAHRAQPDLPAIAVIALTAIMVVTAGMIQVSAAALRLGRLVRFVPFPVVTGFTHGVALVLILAYLPLFLGAASAPGMAWLRLDAISWGPIALGVVTLGVALAASRIDAKLPALFIAFVAGDLAQAAATQWIPGFAPGAMLGLRDAVPTDLPFIEWSTVPLALRDPVLATHVVSFAIAVAAVASIDTLIGYAAAEARLGIRSRPDRDLFAQGMGNVVAGAIGGVANTYGPVQAQAAHSVGARSRAVGPLTAIAVAVLFFASAWLVDQVALAVIAGLMMYVAIRIADPWGFTLIRAITRRGVPADPAVRAAFVNYLVVTLAIVLLDVVAALAVGVMVAAVIFIRTMNQHVVRRVTLGPGLRSRRLFPPAVTRRLAERLHAVALIELQGPLFFGTAERLLEEVARLPATVHYVVFDMRRVQAVDATAKTVITRLHARLRGEGRQVALSGRPTGLGAFDATLPAFVDRDRAIEWVEERLLEDDDLTVSGATIAPAAFARFVGLDGRDSATLLAHTEARSFRKDDTLFRFGDASDYLYYVLSGRVSIVHGPPSATTRVVTLLPGNVFGHVAFIDGKPRMASAVCDVDSQVLTLHRSSLEPLFRESPQVVTQLYGCLANDLAGRLRATDRLVTENQ